MVRKESFSLFPGKRSRGEAGTDRLGSARASIGGGPTHRLMHNLIATRGAVIAHRYAVIATVFARV
jgi:hypothetical protein